MKNNIIQPKIPEGWELKNLGNLVLIKKGEQLNRLALGNSGKYPSLSGGINPSGYTDKWNTEANTITISEGGNSCGYINFNTEKFWCGGHCYALLNFQKNINQSFLYQVLKFNQDKIMKLRVGSGLPNIQKRSIMEFMLLIPPIKEQQKIAEILETVDKDIEKTQEIIDTTEKLKQGLMRRLFTRGIGHIKFREAKLGEIPEEWEEKKLGKISTITNGSTNTQDAIAHGEYPLFDRSVEIKKSNKYLFDSTAIILPGEGAEFIPRYYSGKFDLHQRAYAIFPNKETDAFYLYYYLYANRGEFLKKSVGSTVRSLRLPLVQSVIINIPPAKEQQKIAEILSAVDEKISVNKKLKAKLALLKKGLMRGLLSGRVRAI